MVAHDHRLMITAADLDAELRALRDMVRRIRPPLAHYPEAFHTDKDDVAVRLGQLLCRLAEMPKASVLTHKPDRPPSGREIVRSAKVPIALRRGSRVVEVERRRRA
jgi:hypothetical protein